jgi:hypothetical protein
MLSCFILAAGIIQRRRPSAIRTTHTMAPAGKPQRDVRLDFFRGLALWLIFVDHIPGNIVNWFTLRNYGFSDAAELFVFVSGYTAAFVYGRTMRDRGFIVAGARILKRAWQIYVAHVFLFVIFVAEIAYLSRGFENPLFAEEMNILEFLQAPHQTLFQAMLLKFKPANMDILPVYIVLLLGFPPLLWLLQRAPTAALAGSTALYAVSNLLGWNLPSYPSGQWIINPLCWQLLFAFGAWCAVYGAARLHYVIHSPIVVAAAAAYVVFAFIIVLSWYIYPLGSIIPHWLAAFLYPIDKINLDVLRFAHLVALAVLVMRFLPADAALWKSRLLRPVTLCGEHSLEIFCLGVFLSFAGQFVLVGLSSGMATQIVVSAAGILLMTATAALLSWYKNIGARARIGDADIAGGEA